MTELIERFSSGGCEFTITPSLPEELKSSLDHKICSGSARNLGNAEIAVGAREALASVVSESQCKQSLLEPGYSILPAPVHTENCIRANTRLI